MIDWSRVGELRDEIGPEDFTEIVDLFLTEVEEVTARLRCAPDPARLEEDLHFLKGCALNLGFRRFSALCQKGETASGQGCAETVDIAAILSCYEASKSTFVGGLDSELPA